MKKTGADSTSYYTDGGDLVWDRSFGRLRNTMVLPAGWYLTDQAFARNDRDAARRTCLNLYRESAQR